MFWGNDIHDLCFYGNILTFITFIRGIEQELFRMGMQTRSELDSLHKKEDAYFKQTMEEALKIMNEQHQKVWYVVNIYKSNSISKTRAKINIIYYFFGWLAVPCVN